MVRFSGKLSDECVLYRRNYSTRLLIIIMALIIAVVGIPTIIVAIVLKHSLGEYNEDVLDILAIIMTCLGVLLLLFIMYTATKKKSRVNVIIELSIDAEFIEYTVGPFKPEKIPTCKIKKVISIGDRYYLIRNHGDLSSSIMVEKSLLKEGSIEEFEALFIGKIKVRKELGKI